jgi:competence protein ComFB
MAFIDDYDLEYLKNEAERLVFDELESQLIAYEGEICRCDDCVIDMAAISLNTVKPFYRHSILGSLYAAEAANDKAYAESIQTAVSTAIEKVRKNPAHS